MRVEPKKIIQLYKQIGKVELVAKQLSINRSTVYRWIRRAKGFRRYLKLNISRRSTRPKRPRKALDGDSLLRIIELRKSRGYAPVKIKYCLKLRCGISTIHRALQRHGLIERRGYFRRPLLQPTIHMHAKNVKTIGYLQMDVKYLTPQLTGLTWTCFEYAIIDIYSRYKSAVILNQLDQDGAIAALLEMIPKLPFKPIFIQTDNGLEFQQRFHEFCEGLKLKHHFIHKNTPNENAVIERSFRTDEEEFFFRLPRRPKHYDELRQWLTEFLSYYNNERPHLGINLLTPSQVVANVLKD